MLAWRSEKGEGQQPNGTGKRQTSVPSWRPRFPAGFGPLRRVALTAVEHVLRHEDLVEKLQQQVGFLERSANLFDEGHEDEAFRLAGVMRTLVYDKGRSQSVLGQLGVKDTLRFVDTAEPIHARNLVPTVGLVEIRVVYGASPRAYYAAPLDGEDIQGPRARDNTSQRKRGSRRRRRRATAKPNESIFQLRGVNLVEGADPPDDAGPPYAGEKTFDSWWNDPVTKDEEGSEFPRSAYVRAGAHKEGGVHVDPILEANWAALTRENTLSYYLDGDDIVLGAPTADEQMIPLGNPAPASIRQVAYEVEQTVRTQLAHLL